MTQHGEEKNYGDICPTGKPHIIKQKHDANLEQLDATYP